MHGGAAGSGAPKGNHNALKSGRFTRQEIERRRMLSALMKNARKSLDDFFAMK